MCISARSKSWMHANVCKRQICITLMLHESFINDFTETELKYVEQGRISEICQDIVVSHFDRCHLVCHESTSASSAFLDNFGRHVFLSFAKLCAARTPKCIVSSRCLLVTIACPRNGETRDAGRLVANLPLCDNVARHEGQLHRLPGTCWNLRRPGRTAFLRCDTRHAERTGKIGPAGVKFRRDHLRIRYGWLV